MIRQGDSPSSSIDSSGHPCPSSTSSVSRPTKKDLSTDLRLGIISRTISSASSGSRYDSSSSAAIREHRSDWPPIKPLLRSTLTGKGARPLQATFFVKVYMEGIPIGRKVDLFAHQGYDELIRTLRRMFRTTNIICPDVAQVSSNKAHVLTYEDKEGDWMMVGDVPWEMFLTSVKRLKITRADKC
ncbi:hypothetical protein Taro_029792 [Colocasia esculenta]|uniref:Auxin-responsive protein n=1 Tax=Colocasia esculenta TaxID=4460 RepID=A0A843VS69_COLES|nr:hypothetical protein [Colocasia esculenta]